MFTSKYEEHLASQPDNSRWDGFDRGDLDNVDCPCDQGERVIGRMTNEAGQRVVISEYWCDTDYAYEVFVDGASVYKDCIDMDRTRAITVAQWWMDGCPA